MRIRRLPVPRSYRRRGCEPKSVSVVSKGSRAERRVKDHGDGKPVTLGPCVHCRSRRPRPVRWPSSDGSCEYICESGSLSVQLRPTPVYVGPRTCHVLRVYKRVECTFGPWTSDPRPESKWGRSKTLEPEQQVVETEPWRERGKERRSRTKIVWEGSTVSDDLCEWALSHFGAGIGSRTHTDYRDPGPHIRTVTQVREKSRFLGSVGPLLCLVSRS